MLPQGGESCASAHGTAAVARHAGQEGATSSATVAGSGDTSGMRTPQGRCSRVPFEYGDNPKQGIGVLAGDRWNLRPVPPRSNTPRCLVPVEVTGPREFLLLVVWAKQNELHPYVEGVVRNVEIYRDLILAQPCVLAADLNSNAILGPRASRRSEPQRAGSRALRPRPREPVSHVSRGESLGRVSPDALLSLAEEQHFSHRLLFRSGRLGEGHPRCSCSLFLCNFSPFCGDLVG